MNDLVDSILVWYREAWTPTPNPPFVVPLVEPADMFDLPKRDPDCDHERDPVMLEPIVAGDGYSWTFTGRETEENKDTRCFSSETLRTLLRHSRNGSVKQPLMGSSLSVPISQFERALRNLNVLV